MPKEYTLIGGNGTRVSPLEVTESGTYEAGDSRAFNPVKVNVPSGSTTLSGLTDVDISNPTDGQTLVYNADSGKWENGAGGGGSLLVTLTMTENQEENQDQKGNVKAVGDTSYTITADKTAGEIWGALKAGRCVFFAFTDDMVNNEEYIGYMGPAHYNDNGFFFGTSYAPVEGLVAATDNDYPSDDRYVP